MPQSNITIVQGTSLNLSFIANDASGNVINLSGFSARGQVKYNFGCTGILLDLQPTIDPSFVSGIINISVPQENTTGLPVTKAVYDIDTFNSGDYSFKPFWGYADIYPQVSF